MKLNIFKIIFIFITLIVLSACSNDVIDNKLFVIESEHYYTKSLSRYTVKYYYNTYTYDVMDFYDAPDKYEVNDSLYISRLKD